MHRMSKDAVKEEKLYCCKVVLQYNCSLKYIWFICIFIAVTRAGNIYFNGIICIVYIIVLGISIHGGQD